MGFIGIAGNFPPETHRAHLEVMAAHPAEPRSRILSTCLAPGMNLSAAMIGATEAVDNTVFFSPDKSAVLLLSGECFPSPEMAEADGAAILAGYSKRGPRILSELNGVFAGLLIDHATGRAHLFTDRFGLRRVYVRQTREGLWFATSARPLLNVAPDARGFDADGLSQYIALGCTLGSRTLYKDVETMPAGAIWTFNGLSWERRNYFTPDEWESLEPLSPGEFNEAFTATFQRVLPRYLATKERLGISLTSGLDTRMIMSCLPMAPSVPLSFTFSGLTRDCLDATIGAKVAAACGSDHHILRLRSDFFDDFSEWVDLTVLASDGYLGPLGAHEVYMNQRARALADCRLTGNYGSEILRGVRRFKPLRLDRSFLPTPLKQSVASYASEIPDAKNPTTFAAFEEIPRRRYGILAAGASQLPFRTPYLDNELVRLAYRAPVESRSAGPALHLIRSARPGLLSIPTSRRALDRQTGLRHIFFKSRQEAAFKIDYFFNDGFPTWMSPGDGALRAVGRSLGLIGRHKHLHYRSWFRRELREYLLDRSRELATQTLPFEPQPIRQMITRHVEGRGNFAAEINCALTIDAVQRLFLSPPSNPVTQPRLELRAV